MREKWDELDVLRGLAALLMIWNHAGVDFYGDEPSRGTLEGALTYLGSFAPVVFFFVTGLGYGVGPVGRASRGQRSGLGDKLFVLFAADALLIWQHGGWVGLNFLGFIGVSTIVLEALRSTRFPVLIALAALAATVLIRFGLGPKFLAELPGGAAAFDTHAMATWGAYICGSLGRDEIMYPFFPWVAYPLMGYLVGRAAQQFRDPVRSGSAVVYAPLLAIAVAGTFLGHHWAAQGRVAYRWGVVTIAFFDHSLVVLSVATTIVILVGRHVAAARMASSIHLRGVSSLAVVPLHYVAIAAILPVIPEVPSFGVFFAGGLAIIVAAFSSSVWFGDRLGRLARSEVAGSVWYGLVAATALAAVVLVTADRSETLVGVAGLALGQLALCGMLSIKRPVAASLAVSPQAS